MTKPTLIFTALAAVVLGTQAVRCLLLEHELCSTSPALLPAKLCPKCDDHIEATTPEGELVDYELPADYLQAHSAWHRRHLDAHPDLEIHYAIEYTPRHRKPSYPLGARANGIPLPEATRLMQHDTFPLPPTRVMTTP